MKVLLLLVASLLCISLFGQNLNHTQTIREDFKYLGSSCAISDSFAIVGYQDQYDGLDGAPNDSTTAGSVIIYKFNPSGNWQFFQRIKPENPARDYKFGNAVDITNSHCAIGTSDAVLLFILENNEWVFHQRLTKNNNPKGSHSDITIKMTDNELLIGFSGSSSITAKDPGTVQYYQLADNLLWRYIYKLENPERYSESFGFYIATNDSVLVITSPYDYIDNQKLSSVYIYQRQDSQVMLVQKLDRNDNSYYGDVLLFKNSLLVKLRINTNSSKVFVFKANNSGLWIETNRLYPYLNSYESPSFGFSLRSNENNLFITEPNGDVGPKYGYLNYTEGKIHCYSMVNEEFNLQQTLKLPSNDTVMNFGLYFDVSDNHALIGSIPLVQWTNWRASLRYRNQNLFYEYCTTKSEIQDSLCGGSHTDQNGRIYNDEGVYYRRIKNGEGCDSIIKLELKEPQFDTVFIYEESGVLKTNRAYSNYSWVHCGSHEVLSIQEEFQVLQNGMYQLQTIDPRGCKLFSNCLKVNELTTCDDIQFFSSSNNIIADNFYFKVFDLKVFDMLGRHLNVVYEVSGSKLVIHNLFSPGVYIVRISADGCDFAKKVIVSEPRFH